MHLSEFYTGFTGFLIRGTSEIYSIYTHTLNFYFNRISAVFSQYIINTLTVLGISLRASFIK